MKINIGKYRKNRKVSVKIHDYDAWNADSTLALIVLPLLQEIKKQKVGSPFVDDIDVCIDIQSSSAKPKENDYDIDEFHHDRWAYILDEMIWAFKEYNNEDRESQFYSGKADYIHVPVDEDGNKVDKKNAAYFEMQTGPNHTFKFDEDSQNEYEDRISNGLRLFAKYYSSLWT